MKATIWTGLDAEGLWARVGPRLRKRARMDLHGDGPFTLLWFGADVVLSRAVQKALRRLPDPPERIVAAAETFTADARLLLDQHGGLVMEGHDAHWTDASYLRIRQSF